MPSMPSRFLAYSVDSADVACDFPGVITWAGLRQSAHPPALSAWEAGATARSLTRSTGSLSEGRLLHSLLTGCCISLCKPQATHSVGSAALVHPAGEGAL